MPFVNTTTRFFPSSTAAAYDVHLAVSAKLRTAIRLWSSVPIYHTSTELTRTMSSHCSCKSSRPSSGSFVSLPWRMFFGGCDRWRSQARPMSA